MAKVIYVLGNCPQCGAIATFGNVHLPGGKFLLRGCKVCNYSTQVHLPPIHKKILYLDQFVFSKAFRGGDSRLVAVVQRVTKLLELQLLVLPYSTVHEDETYQWSGYKSMTPAQLMAFIKETARGVQFKPTWNVESQQLVKGIRAFLAGASPEYVFDPQDAITGDVHAYEDYFRIQINRGYIDDIEAIRKAKRQALQLLLENFDSWRASTTSFDENVELEIADIGHTYLSAYRLAIAKSALGDFDAVLNGPLAISLVRQLLYWTPAELSPDDKLAAVNAFFESQHFAALPSVWVAVRMFATLKGMVRDGFYTNKSVAESKLSGFFYDVKHISTYAPYCDAFFMDDAMRELVNRPTVDLTKRFGTQAFSLNNLDSFTDWLDSVENSITAEHKTALALAYPHWPA